ncbi:MAG: hypothetical protein COA79_00170 [Planctomycetota bacterium]|nr:MAG: hypothetical protein COA79_00170 [Planctomycetota bacterium]
MKKSDIYITVFGAIFGVIGLIAIFSLISYKPEDVSGVSYPVTGTIQNICGVWGAHLADFLYYYFGFASYLVSILVCTGCFCLLGAINVDSPVQKVSGSLFLIVSTCGWLGMTNLSPEVYNWTLPSNGGVLGFFFHHIFTAKVGLLGEVLCMALMSFLGLFLIFEYKIFYFLQNLSKLFFIGLKTIPVSNIYAKLQNNSQLELDGVSSIVESERINLNNLESNRINVLERSSDSLDIIEESSRLKKKRISAEEKQLIKEKEEQDKAETLERQKEARKKQAAMAAEIAVKEAQKRKTKNNTKLDSTGLDDDTPVQKMKGDDKAYVLPTIDLLDEPVEVEKEKPAALEERAIRLIETLADFGIPSELISIVQGPVVTMYEISIGKGIRVQKILNLPDNIAMALMAISVRIIAPLPGKSTIGIEIPNRIKEEVRMMSIIDSDRFDRSKFTLPVVLGKDAAGNPLITDITRMPHVLIAGATGSGKSVCLNSLIVSLLMFCRPEELKMVLIDPKMVEMKGYEGLPHLSMPVVVDMKKATAVFERLVDLMEKRYRVLSRVGVRNIASYNAMKKADIIKKLDKYEDVNEEDVVYPMPYIVIIVDELADLMMSAPKEVEVCITRLAQKSRAVGIHVVLATQRPSVDVVTGLIKSNMPTRISFQTASKIDSRTILDQQGAERLLGMGDMLFMPPGSSKLMRAQGVYLSDDEINRIIEHCTKQKQPEYDEELVNAVPTVGKNGSGALPGDDDELFTEAVRIILESERGSASLLQRKMSIGYNRASRLIELMEERGIIGPHKGSVARDLYMTLEEWESIQAGNNPT